MDDTGGCSEADRCEDQKWKLSRVYPEAEEESKGAWRKRRVARCEKASGEKHLDDKNWKRRTKNSFQDGTVGSGHPRRSQK